MLARSLSLGTIVVLLASPLAAQATHPNFTGTWVLDSTKTVIDGQMPGPLGATYVVMQVGDSISVNQKMMSVAGEQAATKVWRVDGKPWANKVSYGGVDLALSSTLSWVGSVLTIRTTTDFQGTAVEQAETWTMGPDGKTLTQSITTSVSGDYYASMTLVFNKK